MKRETANRRARNISSIILNEEEIFEFLKFIKNDYGNLLDSPLAQRRYERDKERELRIDEQLKGLYSSTLFVHQMSSFTTTTKYGVITN